MKRLLTLILCAGLLVSCGNKQDAPVQVAKEFLTCFFSSDFEGAKTYAAPELLQLLNDSKSLLDSLSGEEHQKVIDYLSAIQVDIETPEKINGDTLQLSYSVIFSKFTGTGKSSVSLRKEGRKWLVYALE